MKQEGENKLGTYIFQNVSNSKLKINAVYYISMIPQKKLLNIFKSILQEKEPEKDRDRESELTHLWPEYKMELYRDQIPLMCLEY